MNNGYCYAMKRKPDQQLNGLFDKVKSGVKKVTSTVKNVAQDSGKLLANAATTNIRAIQGKDPLYSGSDFNTKAAQAASKVQNVVGKASVAIASTVVPVAILSQSGGSNTLIDPNTQAPQTNLPPDDTLQASAGNLSPGKIAAGVGIVLALGTLIYFTTENN